MSPTALEQTKVLEFTWFAAGPVVGKYMADYGAKVIHVESKSRPDGFRNYPPFKKNRPGINRSLTFAVHNNNKYGITLNLRHASGKELAKRLMEWADVIIENFTPGVMDRLGLGYNTLKKVKPEIIMLSTCNQGQTGPHASHPGFGTHLTNLTGFTHITGWPDRTPLTVTGPYVDYISAAFGVVAVLAALDYRRKTGKGQWIDISQYETGLQFIAAALLDYNTNGRVANRMGNRSSFGAPHGAYACRGTDRWCVISVFNDTEWENLRRVMDIPELGSPKFNTVLGRKQNEGDLDRLINDWTSCRSAEEVVGDLQANGVRAALVQDIKELLEDPDLKEYAWRKIEHPLIGKHTYFMGPFKLSKTPAEIKFHGHLLGEHNNYVYHSLLGLANEELAELEEQKVFD